MGDGVAVSVDLSGGAMANGENIVGYRAKRHTAVIDVEQRAAYDIAEFWEPIAARADRSLILDPDEFYILASTEAVQVPPDYAAEMVPFDPSSVSFACTMPAFLTQASATLAPAVSAPVRCWRCGRGRCRSFSSTVRSWPPGL